jgi:hypothetical protein
MTAGEHQAEAVVGWVIIGLVGSALVRRPQRLQRLELGSLCGQRLLAAQAVDRAVASDLGDPGARIVRNAVNRPALERDDERLLDRLLGGVEIAKDPDQGRDRPPRLMPEQTVDDLATTYEETSAAAGSPAPIVAS